MSKVDERILKSISDKDKDTIALLYSSRHDKGIAKHFTDSRAIQKAKEGKVLNAISIQYKLDFANITAICRQKGVITAPPRHRIWKKNEVVVAPKTNGWFTVVANPDFASLAKEFLQTKHNMVQIDMNAPEFTGMTIEKIVDGFKYKHGVKIVERHGLLFLCRK